MTKHEINQKVLALYNNRSPLVMEFRGTHIEDNWKHRRWMIYSPATLDLRIGYRAGMGVMDSPPLLVDILYALYMDSQWTNYSPEELMNELGYEDCRKSKKIIEGCKRSAKLYNLIVPDEIREELEEILSEY